MFFWRKKKIRDEAEVQELESRLSHLEKVELDTLEKQRIKQHVMLMVEKFATEERITSDLFRLKTQINKLGSKVKPSAKVEVLMRERISAFIRQTSLLEVAFGSRGLSHFLKGLLSVALLFCFVFTTVFFWPTHVPVTLAANHTYFEEVFGKVSVLRQGKIYPGHKNFSLEEGDMVITDDKSLATVHFFDDSTSRLSQHTQLQLKRLYSEPFSPVTSHIEVSLQEGQLWTRVVNLVDDNSQFVVDTDQTRAIVNKKAAFDIQVFSTKDILTVFDNVVGFSVKDDVGFQSKPVLAGFQAQVDHDQGPKTAKIFPLDKAPQPHSFQQDWFSSNLRQDKIHAEKLVVEKEDNLQSGSESKNNSILPDKIDIDQSKVIANAEIEQQRLYFLENFRLLQKGETFLVRKNAGEGLKLILQFQNVMRSFMKKIDEFEKKDPLNAALLRSFIENKIAEQRKDLATFLPGDALYPAKEILEDIELMLIDNETDKVLRRLTQAEDKLLEIQDLVEQSKLQQAEVLLSRYKRQIDEFVLKVNDDSMLNFKQKLVPLLNHQFDHIKVLTSIEKSLNNNDQQLFLISVRKVRHEVLEKFIATLEILPDAVPRHLIRELKDLLQTYLGSAVRDDEFIVILNRLLVSYGETNLLELSTRLPNKLGVVRIIEDDTAASPPSAPISVPSSQEVSLPMGSQEIPQSASQQSSMIQTSEIESQEQVSPSSEILTQS